MLDNLQLAINDTYDAIDNGELIKLSEGVPDCFFEETFFSIAARYASGNEQDAIVEALKAKFPEFAD